MFEALFASSITSAQTYRPDFDPGQYKGSRAGTLSELLVLGTVHISGLPASFKVENLSALIDRLAAWKPQAIATEDVSGPQCDFMRRYPGRYRDTVDAYCLDPAPAMAATGLDVAAATAQSERLLAHWPAIPTPVQRRHLAAVFLAGGERASALVQWLRLPETERHPGDGLNDILVAQLEKLRERRNETTLIAAALAARVGLERVYSMDDHTADAVVADESGYNAAMTKAWDNPASARRKTMYDVAQAQLKSPESALAMYRELNAPGRAKLIFDRDFGAALEEVSPQKFGRGYVGYWETRNLRMAGNIRDMLQTQPGIRALVIVGESHKGYLEAYLNPMHDLVLQDAEAVLK